MTILITYPELAKTSALQLADALNATAINPYRKTYSAKKYSGIINYGCGDYLIQHKNIVNKPDAVRGCINKLHTFRQFTLHDIPTVTTTNHKEIAKQWNSPVWCRQTLVGHANEGLLLAEAGTRLPNALLYTKHFEHDYEFRVVVLFGKVVAHYKKIINEETGKLDFWTMPKPNKRIEKMAIKAAKALSIDFVGFDVLFNNNTKQFVFLEANSAPTITDDVIEAFQSYL